MFVILCLCYCYTPNSKSLERAWSRGIVFRTKEYSFVPSTMPRLHARSRLLELGVLLWPDETEMQLRVEEAGLVMGLSGL